MPDARPQEAPMRRRRDAKIERAWLAGAGLAEIAAQAGVTPQRVSQILKARGAGVRRTIARPVDAGDLASLLDPTPENSEATGGNGGSATTEAAVDHAGSS